jgi:hypothetical protein
MCWSTIFYFFIVYIFYPFDDGLVSGLSDLTTTYFNIGYPIYILGPFLGYYILCYFYFYFLKNNSFTLGYYRLFYFKLL